MAKGLNFRSFKQPTLPINMNDAEETLFTVTQPSVEMVERLEANKDEIIATFEKGDRESMDELWKFAAELISFNREGRKVAVEDLKGKYGVDYEMLFAFFAAYGEFLDEINSAKN